MGKFNTAKQFINQIFGGAQKTTGTEVKNFVGVAKNLKKKRAVQDDIVKTRDKIFRDYKTPDENKVQLRTKSNQPKINKKISDILESKAKGGRVGLKGGSDLGMQSVKYGLDNNPKITAADPKAKFIAANKKKKKKFDSPMAKAIKKKNNKKVI